VILPQELQAARLRLAQERPYLASAAWALQPVPKPGLGTMAVDMYWRLYYDPEAISSWPVEEVEGVLYHEICHLLRNHAARMQGLHPRLSNIAADAEVNDDLVREGVRFPTQPLTPQSIGQPENLLAEEYYDALASQEFQGSGGSASNEPSSTKDKEENKAEGGPAKQNNAEGEQPEPGSGRCGSCATGQKEPWEDGPPGEGTSFGLGPTEGELIRRDVANQIREYSKGRGKVPGHLARWAETTLQPEVDWRKQLAAAIRFAMADTAGASDYSYRRPSRRQAETGKSNVIFPSMRCPVPTVAVVADTSASVSDFMLARTLAEITAILKAVGQKEGVSVLAVDQSVAFCRKVFRPGQVKLTGGGGTDMGVGLQAAAKLKPLPRLGIVITDGYTSWPEKPPRGMKVIVVLTGGGTAPEWAKVIRVKQA